MKYLFKLFRKQFVKYLNEERKPTQLSSLEFRFEYEGHRYYGFPESLQIKGADRYLHLLDVLMMTRSGITTDDAGDLLKIMTDNVVKALEGNKEAAATLTKCVFEMSRRKDMLLQPGLMLEEAATCLIREDENPDIIDWDIHRQKVEAFRNLLIEKHEFFFRLPELRNYIQISTLSPSEFMILWIGLMGQERTNSQMMQKIKSSHSSLFTEKRQEKKTISTP